MITVEMKPTSSVTSMRDIFPGSGLSTENYDALLIGWAAQSVRSGVDLDAGELRYSGGPAADARQRLLEEHDWRIEDGGMIE